MPIEITMLQHTVYRQSEPIWVDDMDPVWVIQYNTVYKLLSRIVIVPSGTYSYFPYPLLCNMQHDIR